MDDAEYEVEQHTALGFKLRKKTLRTIDSGLEKLRSACEKDERLDVIVLLSKDGISEVAVCSRDVEGIPIAQHWKEEGGHMIRECKKRARSIRALQRGADVNRSLCIDEQCAAVRICQRAIVSGIPGKSKTLAFRRLNVTKDELHKEQKVILAQHAPWWPFDKHGWQSFDRPSIQQREQAKDMLELFIQHMSPAQVKEVLRHTKSWSELDIFEYLAKRLTH
eukprot:scaffold6_cov330-Pavlova_lutheri.AAC.28